MRILVVEPEKEPYVKDIENELLMFSGITMVCILSQ